MSTGTPIITTNVGGIAEIFDESKGIMIDAGNENQLIDAMNKMIENISLYNPQKIREFAVDNFSEEVISTQFDKLYHEATKN
jgi:glycosyltransferase involved in cell wall biosynthesis